MRRFYLKMTDPRYNQKVDVYVYMFICEFLSFWIIIFGYQSFGPSVSATYHIMHILLPRLYRRTLFLSVDRNG